MVRSCSGYECQNRFEKGGKRFHLFPDNKELCDKWIAAMRLENITITKENRESYLICEDHFRPEDYNNPLDPKSRLKKDSVPSKFSLPSHLKPATSTRRKAPTERTFSLPHPKKKLKIEEGPTSSTSDAETREKQLEDKLSYYRKKVRSLQQQIRRKNRKIKSLSEVIKELKDNSSISSHASDVLDHIFVV